MEAEHRMDGADVNFPAALGQEHLLDQPLPWVTGPSALLDVEGGFVDRVIMN